jgi:hypothetical protein
LVRGKTRPKRKAKPVKKKNIRLKTASSRNRRPKRHSVSRNRSFHDFGTILNRQVRVGTLLRYSGIVLAFLAVLLIVFLLGRLSAADDSPEKGTTITGNAKQTVKSGSAELETPASGTDPEETVVEANLSADEGIDEELPAEEAEEYIYETAPVVGHGATAAEDDDEPECDAKNAEFDYEYSNVAISVTDFKTEKKGDNWAVINSLELSITNNEDCTIVNPTQVKMKLNNKGKGATWWDDEVFLPDSFRKMKPGDTVTETITVHVTYADIYMEKEFRLYVFDDYGIEMGVFKKYLTLS